MSGSSATWWRPARAVGPADGARRVVHSLLAMLLVLALILQVVVVIRHTNETLGVRLVRLVSYFTIQSNVLVLVTSVGLALQPARRGMLWKVLRLDAIAGISVTGVVYAAVLAGSHPLHGVALFCDVVFHYVVPAVAALSWIVLGPRPRLDADVVSRGLVWPVLWFAYTLLHGAISHWYPYPFVDITRDGYPRVLLNAAVVVVLLGLILCLLWFVDRRARPTPGPAHPSESVTSPVRRAGGG